MTTLIDAGDTWLLWAVVAGVAGFGLWAEKTRWGRHLTGYVICIAVAAALSNTRIIPSDAPPYDAVWGYFVPLAIPLLLFRADLRRIVRESGPLLLAFGLGTIGTIIGVVVAYYTVPLDEEARRMTASFCATYIGGSINYAACAEAAGLRSTPEAASLLAAGVAADNILTTLTMLLLFALPSIGVLRRRYRERPGLEAAQADSDAGPHAYWEARPVSLQDLAVSLGAGVALCAAGYGLAPYIERYTPLENSGILVVTALAVLLATLLPGRIGKLNGGEVLGAYLMHVFFVVVGASANVAAVIAKGPMLFLFATIVIAVHLLFLLGSGWLCRLDLREIVVASNANVGGPPTAVALAVARRWDALIIPAILCGTLGYAVATFIGVALARWLGAM